MADEIPYNVDPAVLNQAEHSDDTVATKKVSLYATESTTKKRLTATTNSGKVGLDVNVTNSATVDTELPTAAALADDTANPTVPAVGAFGMVYDGTTWDRLRGTSADGMLVNLGANNDVTVTQTTSPWVVGGDVGTLDQFDLTNSNPAVVAIVDANGDQITSFGGGTQYTEGDTDATITGTALMLEGAANALSAAVGGAGAVSAAVQRVTLASDDPAVTALQIIDDTVFTDDTSTHTTASSKGIGIMGVATPTDTSVNANDFGHIAMTTDRQMLARATVASGGIASGAIASGAVASGAFASGSIATGAIVDALADDAAFTPATSRVFPTGFFADETATDSVDEGDIGIARMTLDRRQITASQNNDDAAWTASSKVSVAGYVFDDASIDVLDEGDVGYARVDSQRRQYVNIGGGVPVFGQTTSTATTEVQITSTSVIVQTIRITALSSNTEPIYIGLTGLTTTASSTELLPGDVLELHGSFNANTLYFRKATAVSAGVTFVYQP